jgi:preprotein translocase subunit SecD
VVGLVLIVVFMLIYYKLSGVNAIIAMLFNLVILLGLMAYIGQVMTLPGFAGFILTIGIGVDSNVLIFERIKEELAAGKGVKAAIAAGFVLTMGIGVDSNVLIFERIKEELDNGRPVRASINAGFGRVFLTLLDTHISAMIAAAFLFQFGTGPIRGFATTLVFGLISNLFTSTFVSKTLFELALGRRERVVALSI